MKVIGKMTNEELQQFCMERAKDEWNAYSFDDHQDLEFCLEEFAHELLKKLNIELED